MEYDQKLHVSFPFLFSPPVLSRLSNSIAIIINLR